MSRRRPRALAVLALAPIAVGGCGDSTSPGEPLALCTGPVTVQAEPIANGGRISWTPQCGVRSLGVPVPPSAGYSAMLWHLEQDARSIAPGLRYGDEPAGTRTRVPAAKLPSGTVQSIWLHGSGNEVVATYQWRT